LDQRVGPTPLAFTNRRPDYGQMTSGTLIGDGLALDSDLFAAADSAVEAALTEFGDIAPDLACIFVSGGAPAETAAVLAHAAAAIGARNSLGCTAHGVIGQGRGVESARGVSVWVARLPGVEVRAFHLEVMRTTESIAILGMPERREADVVGLVLADPWSFPIDGFIDHSDTVLNGLPLVGGLASGANQSGETRLLLDGHVHERGAVGVFLGGDLSVHALVSQGCRPIGQPMTVTDSEDSLIFALAGRPALEQAMAVVDALPELDRAMAIRGLQLGVAIDEYRDDFAHGDFLVRGIVGADQVAGSLTIGDVIGVGTTVQFQLRDADAAHEDLTEVLSAFRNSRSAQPIAGALLITCTGRGRSLFESGDHDIDSVRDTLGIDRVAGFFAAGEIGPVAGRNHLHGFTATVLAFCG